MTDAAEDYDEDLSSAIEDLMAGVVRLDKTPADKIMNDIGRLQMKVKQAREILKEFEAEIRELPKSEAANFVPRAQEHKQSLAEIDERLKQAREKASAQGAAPVVKRERTADEMIDEAKKVQAKSAQSVDRSKELVNNMIEVGGATVSELKEQTVTFERMNEKVEDIQSELALARKQMVAFARRMATDRLIRAFMILILLGTVAVLGVGIWKKTAGAPVAPGTVPVAPT